MITLNISRDVFNEKFYPLLTDYSHRWEVYMGSAGSGKSHFIVQKLIVRAIRESGIRILVCRKYGTTIRQTVFSLFKQVLKDWSILPYVRINEADYRIRFPNDSEIVFLGLDSETKLLSLNNISTIWVEETFEVEKDMIEQLNLRMRGKQSDQQIILSFNPISRNSWLYELVEHPPASFLYHHSTYRDNRFLPAEYVRSLQEMEERNPQKARVFCLGEWGTPLEGLVLRNWREEKLDVGELAKKYEHRCGMDFGYQDPSAIIESFYDRANNTIYVTQVFYRTGQQLDDLLVGIQDMQLQKSLIYADAAEPRTIEFFRRNGVNMRPCIKGQGSIEAGIAFLQNHTIVVDPSCTSFIHELSNFSYLKDRSTGRYRDNAYTHEFSHSIDALRYAYSDIYKKGTLQTLSKSALGL